MEGNGFKIICLNCNGIDVKFEEEIYYDYEENPYTVGYIMYCKGCGQEQNI